MLRQSCFLVCLLLTFAQFHSVAADPLPLPGWDVSWFDEFNGTSVDTALWNVITSTSPTNDSRQAYLPSQVTVDGGNLVITATDQSFGNLPYRSGQVISKASRRLGKWEVRAQLPTSKGQWPAIWLLPDVQSAPWPSQGEIDIMENRGDQPHLTSSAFHYGTNPPYNHQFVYQEQSSRQNGSSQNYHDSFHTYGVEWSEDVLRFFVDGVNYYNVHDADVGGFLGSQTSGMETVINNAIGGHFLDDPDSSTVWPQQMLIDYVHVYQASATPAPLQHENGSFEADPTGASPLAEWTTFGVRDFGNVAPHSEAVRSGDHSLKLFGQFSGGTNFSGVEQGISVSGGDEVRAIVHDFIRSGDSIAGTDNQVSVNIDYYSKRHGKFGSSDYLSTEAIVIADGSTANNQWLMHELRSVAPVGAVEARMAVVFRQPSGMGGAVHIDDTVFGLRGDNALNWDGNGNGLWTDSRWLGVGPAIPNDFDRAVVRSNRVAVVGNQEAYSTFVESGELQVTGQLTSDVVVEANGTIINSGTIVGELTIDGALLVESAATLTVSQTTTLDTTQLLIADTYDQTRGTFTGDFTLIDAAAIVGTLNVSEGDHLGDGFFLNNVAYTGTQAMVDIYSALPGDANGDGTVDGGDFLIWNAFKFSSGTDWTTGDFNGDGITDGGDFLVWNEHKFTTADHGSPQTVPEPLLPAFLLLLLPLVWRKS